MVEPVLVLAVFDMLLCVLDYKKGTFNILYRCAVKAVSKKSWRCQVVCVGKVRAGEVRRGN